MLVEEIKNIKSDRKELRKFGLTLGVVCALIGLYLLWRKQGNYLNLLILAGNFFLLGIIVPVILKPIYKAWMTLSILLGWVMTRIILILLFYLMITPLGLLKKLFGNNSLHKEFNRGVDSYWILKKNLRVDKKNYENQF